MEFEAVIGLETHVELLTESKMFCGCPVVDSVSAAPNTAVCPVCAGLPGTLPVVNERAVEFALRVALALGCRINPVSVFARKNYFYPDLPKGYQISQYEQPLAVNGRLMITTSKGERNISIRRVHLEEDTGKLAHFGGGVEARPYSLVDLNRAGVPLLEIVTEPDFRSAEEVRVYAESLRRLLRYLGVNSGDLEKGVLRVEPNISIRPALAGGEAAPLGTKVEIKNLNSFRALERGVAYEIRRQAGIVEAGGAVEQQTVGWDEAAQATLVQRTKEEADDYRYFPEPDLPPLRVSEQWVEAVRSALPELPETKRRRFVEQYGLPEAQAVLLVEERATAEYFERAAGAGQAPARAVADWMTGELFARLNEAGLGIDQSPIAPEGLAELVAMVTAGEINANTGKAVLAEMFAKGSGTSTGINASAREIVAERGLGQVSDAGFIGRMVTETLAENPAEVASYRDGKTTVANWLFGQVMKKAGGRADPRVVRKALLEQLEKAGDGGQGAGNRGRRVDDKKLP
jgi:aspartyl-tRNA(Asn)/glutamyl-tRNA(Gln) amidotransferase subunit B